MTLTFNPTDYKNIVANIGEPPASDDFSTATSETIERGFVRIDDESHTDTVPLIVAGFPPEAAWDADEAAENAGSTEDLLSSLGELLNRVLADRVIEMNPAEIERATALFGEPPVPVVGNDEVALGCTRVDGDEHCDPEASLNAGVLARAEDGSLYVTSGDVDGDVEFSA